MKTEKEMFDRAYSYAQMITTCNKVAVGAIFVVNDKEIFSCNRNNEGHSCIVNGQCYKADLTGTYESCEETRKFCKASHAEINLVNNPKFIRLKNGEVETGTLYVTRYPCVNCMKEVASRGIRKIKYCGVTEISEEAGEIAEEYGVTVEHYPEYDYEDRLHENWWTNEFYDKAYDLVKDNKYPIVIPSYNRPGLKSVNEGFLSEMDDEYNYPIFIFVRESQREDYEKSLKNKYAKIISYPDEVIGNAGAVRRAILKWLNREGYKAAFSFDDDLQGIVHTEKQFTEKGDPKAGRNKSHTNICKTLAMWQVSMNKAINDYGVLISGVMPMAFSWKPEYTTTFQSMLLYRGLPSQAVCINAEGLMREGLIYRDNEDCGHEDIDITIRIIDSGNSVCVFPFLAHCAPEMSVENWDFKDLDERFEHQQKIMKSNHSDKDWVKFSEKRNLKQVSINWPAVRKARGITEYIFDIWKSGSLLSDYCN